MKHTLLKKLSVYGMSFLIVLQTFLHNGIFASATVDYAAEAEERKNQPVQTNEIENWPKGPAIGAQSAILMEANTGTILYAKNIDEQLYPASTTKIMTCLLAMENCSLDEKISFSHDAVFSIERGSSNAGMDVGEEITFREALYIMLLYSANEVCNAVGEHVSGSMSGFAELMNQRAAELGCTNTNFVNSNGLPDDNHYTSARDLALISAEFFKNETLSKISGTNTYMIYPSEKQPDEFAMYNHHKMCSQSEYAYEGFIGGKTGYTNSARQTLVSCAERDGMKLICVILKEESPNQFLDTRDLFDYGFQNFQIVNVAANETAYTVDNSEFFNTNSDIFGSSKPIISINTNDYIVLPITADFADTSSSLAYDVQNDNSIATINYEYNGVSIGNATVNLTGDTVSYDFKTPPVVDETAPAQTAEGESNVIFVNILKIILIVVGIAVFLILLIIIRAFIKNYHFSRKRNLRIAKKRRRHRKRFDYLDFH